MNLDSCTGGFLGLLQRGEAGARFVGLDDSVPRIGIPTKGGRGEAGGRWIFLYSRRNATMGSTVVARRAGTQQASIANAARRATTPARTGGLVAFVIEIDGIEPILRGAAHQSVGQLPHLHLLHQRYPADLCDRESARRATSRCRPRAAEERLRLRPPPAQDRSDAAGRLGKARIRRVFTVHDGYGYLLQEFGIDVAGVVQPAHGLTPSAGELREMVKLLKREGIRIVFTEERFLPSF